MLIFKVDILKTCYLCSKEESSNFNLESYSSRNGLSDIWNTMLLWDKETFTAIAGLIALSSGVFVLAVWVVHQYCSKANTRRMSYTIHHRVCVCVFSLRLNANWQITALRKSRRLIPVAARSKGLVCSLSLAGIARSNTARNTDVRVLWMLCVIRQRFLRRTDASCREVLPSVCVIVYDQMQRNPLHLQWVRRDQNKKWRKIGCSRMRVSILVANLL